MIDKNTPRSIAARTAPAARPGLREPAIGLSLSGGGYRAMLFHVGALRRLNELGLLGVVDRISSVSGGSITASALALGWRDLEFTEVGVASAFNAVEQHLFNLAGRTIDLPSITWAFIPGRSAAKALANSYRRHLLGPARMQDLPDSPRFVFNTTNMSTGGLMRWSKPYAADHRLGSIFEPDLPLADVVAASSAFPPFLSPLLVTVPGELVDHDSGEVIPNPPAKLALTDGGVYDNLGLQPLESYQTVLASDGGSPFHFDPRLRFDWLSQSLRTLHLINGQVRGLRRRGLVKELATSERLGALWTINTEIGNYPAAGTVNIDGTIARDLATLSTRLKALPILVRKRLINLGYALCDAAVRSYVETSLPPPTDLPYPEAPLSSAS